MKITLFLKEKTDAAISGLYPGTVCDYDISIPPGEACADLAVNAGFLLAKSARKPPALISSEIAAALSGEPGISSAAGAAGYVNILFDNKALKEELTALIRDKDYFRNTSMAGRKVNLEFVSANPVGPLNVVSGRAAAYGDTLARLYEASGAKVHRENYVNDFGRQTKLFAASLKSRYFELHDIAVPFPEEGYKGDYVSGIAESIDSGDKDAFTRLKSMLDAGDDAGLEAWFKEYGISRVIEWQKRTLGDFGVKHDMWFSETTLHTEGKVEKAVDFLREKGALFTEEGAEWLDTMKYGDDKNRVVRKQDGEYTYLASDIAYMKDKLERGAGLVVNILGPDHHGYIKRLEAIMQWLGYPVGNLKVIILQQVNLLDAGEKMKMSKREGRFVSLDDLVAETGADAARYYFLMRNYNSHLDFDVALASEKSDKNPVFYLQYGCARAHSVLKHAAEKGFSPSPERAAEADFSRLEKEERELIMKMIMIPDVIESAAAKDSPSALVQHMYGLVSSFHSFYAKHRVVTDDRNLTDRRLAIMEALKKSLKEAFAVIGISAPEHM